MKNFEFHRLILPTFLHVDLWHILMNTISMIFLGYEIEAILGKLWYSVLFFGSSINGFLFSAVCYPNTHTVGASAGIMGLFGFFVV